MEGYVFKNRSHGVPYIGIFDTQGSALRYIEDYDGPGQFVLLKVRSGEDSPSGDITFKQVGTGTAM